MPVAKTVKKSRRFVKKHDATVANLRARAAIILIHFPSFLLSNPVDGVTQPEAIDSNDHCGDIVAVYTESLSEQEIKKLAAKNSNLKPRAGKENIFKEEFIKQHKKYIKIFLSNSNSEVNSPFEVVEKKFRRRSDYISEEDGSEVNYHSDEDAEMADQQLPFTDDDSCDAHSNVQGDADDDDDVLNYGNVLDYFPSAHRSHSKRYRSAFPDLPADAVYVGHFEVSPLSHVPVYSVGPPKFRQFFTSIHVSIGKDSVNMKAVHHSQFPQERLSTEFVLQPTNVFIYKQSVKRTIVYIQLIARSKQGKLLHIWRSLSEFETMREEGGRSIGKKKAHRILEDVLKRRKKAMQECGKSEIKLDPEFLDGQYCSPYDIFKVLRSRKLKTIVQEATGSPKFAATLLESIEKDGSNGTRKDMDEDKFDTPPVIDLSDSESVTTHRPNLADQHKQSPSGVPFTRDISPRADESIDPSGPPTRGTPGVNDKISYRHEGINLNPSIAGVPRINAGTPGPDEIL